MGTVCLSTTCTKTIREKGESSGSKCLWTVWGSSGVDLRDDSALFVSGLSAVLMRTPGTSGVSQLSMH